MSLLLAALVAAVQVAATNEVTRASSNRTAQVTSRSAYYDRTEGYAYLNGDVFVDDAEYQLHADRAYLILDGTNAFKRVAALGHVVMTNGMRRASGGKAVYHRKSGLVVLTAAEDAPAEVCETDDKGGERLLRGKKIRFWTRTHQVEVEEAWISAPRSGSAGDGIRGVLGR